MGGRERIEWRPRDTYDPLYLLANSAPVFSVFATFVLELRCLHCKHLCFLCLRVGSTERFLYCRFYLHPLLFSKWRNLGASGWFANLLATTTVWKFKGICVRPSVVWGDTVRFPPFLPRKLGLSSKTEPRKVSRGFAVMSSALVCVLSAGEH